MAVETLHAGILQYLVDQKYHRAAQSFQSEAAIPDITSTAGGGSVDDNDKEQPVSILVNRWRAAAELQMLLTFVQRERDVLKKLVSLYEVISNVIPCENPDLVKEMGEFAALPQGSSSVKVVDISASDLAPVFAIVSEDNPCNVRIQTEGNLSCEGQKFHDTVLDEEICSVNFVPGCLAMLICTKHGSARLMGYSEETRSFSSLLKKFSLLSRSHVKQSIVYTLPGQPYPNFWGAAIWKQDNVIECLDHQGQHKIFSSNIIGHAKSMCVTCTKRTAWLMLGLDDGSITRCNLSDPDDMLIARGQVGHERAVECLAGRPDGIFFSSGRDQVIKMWRQTDAANSRECVAEIKGHRNWVRSLYVRDNFLLSSSDDGSLCSWDLDGGREMSKRCAPVPLTAIYLSSSGRSIMAVGNSKLYCCSSSKARRGERLVSAVESETSEAIQSGGGRLPRRNSPVSTTSEVPRPQGFRPSGALTTRDDRRERPWRVSSNAGDLSSRSNIESTRKKADIAADLASSSIPLRSRRASRTESLQKLEKPLRLQMGSGRASDDNFSIALPRVNVPNTSRSAASGSAASGDVNSARQPPRASQNSKHAYSEVGGKLRSKKDEIKVGQRAPASGTASPGAVSLATIRRVVARPGESPSVPGTKEGGGLLASQKETSKGLGTRLVDGEKDEESRTRSEGLHGDGEDVIEEPTVCEDVLEMKLRYNAEMGIGTTRIDTNRPPESKRIPPPLSSLPTLDSLFSIKSGTTPDDEDTNPSAPPSNTRLSTATTVQAEPATEVSIFPEHIDGTNSATTSITPGTKDSVSIPHAATLGKVSNAREPPNRSSDQRRTGVGAEKLSSHVPRPAGRMAAPPAATARARLTTTAGLDKVSNASSKAALTARPAIPPPSKRSMPVRVSPIPSATGAVGNRIQAGNSSTEVMQPSPSPSPPPPGGPGMMRLVQDGERYAQKHRVNPKRMS